MDQQYLVDIGITELTAECLVNCVDSLKSKGQYENQYAHNLEQNVLESPWVLNEAPIYTNVKA